MTVDGRKPHIRKSPEERRAQLLEAAFSIAVDAGVKGVTRLNVAAATDTTDGLINRYFKGRKGLRAAVLEEAVRVKRVDVLAYAQSVEGFELPADMPRQLARDVRKFAAENYEEVAA